MSWRGYVTTGYIITGDDDYNDYITHYSTESDFDSEQTETDQTDDSIEVWTSPR